MVDDTDPAVTGFALQGQFALELAELVHFQHGPHRRQIEGIVFIAGYGFAFAADQVGKDTASDQGRGDGDGHQCLADTSRAGKNHGMRDAVFVDEAGELFFQAAVADNRIKQCPVHHVAPLRQ